MLQSPAPNLWQHSPDVEYTHHFLGHGFLPIVEGLANDWNEQDLEATIQQSIDAALDAGRLDVVKQLARHL